MRSHCRLANGLVRVRGSSIKSSGWRKCKSLAKAAYFRLKKTAPELSSRGPRVENRNGEREAGLTYFANTVSADFVFVDGLTFISTR